MTARGVVYGPAHTSILRINLFFMVPSLNTSKIPSASASADHCNQSRGAPS